MNEGFSLSVSSLVNAAEKELHYRPRRPNGLGIIFAHGAGGLYSQAQERAKGLFKLFQAMARSGYHVLCPDLGGQHTFGNDLVADRMESARQVLIGFGCGPDVVIVGASMGNLSSMRYIADHVDNVICGVGLIPAVDIVQLRANNVLGLRTAIEGAWGIGTEDPIPARGIILDRVDDMTDVPWAAWYGSADTAVDAADVVAMAAALGPDSQAVAYDSTLDHTDPLLAALPREDVIDWINARTNQ